MTELSVIIPLYNAAEYIDQCIRSVMAQRDVSMEILVIDDGSKDNSIDIVNSIECKFLKFFQKENGGASSARNFGLEKANGKYIMFVDADDWIEDETICRRCIDKIEIEQLDLCIFNFKYFYNNRNRYSEPTTFSKDLLTIFEANDLIRRMVVHGHFPASPCFRIIKKDFLQNNNISFIEHTTAEDIEWFTHVLVNVKRLGFISDAAYIYRKNVATSVTGSRSNQKCKNLLLRLKDSIQWANQLDDAIRRDYLLSALAYEFCILLGNIAHISDNNELVKEAEEIKFLLNYKLFPKVKYLSLACKVLGIRFVVYILGVYIRKFAKSNKS